MGGGTRKKLKKTCINRSYHQWEVADEYTERCKRCTQVIANRAWMSKQTSERHAYYRSQGISMQKGGMQLRWTYNKMVNLMRILPISYKLYVNPGGAFEGIIANSLYHLRYECGMNYKRIKKIYHLQDQDVDYFIMKFPYVHYK